MKKTYLFILLLTTLECTLYIVRETSQYDLIKDELDFLKSKKIGLIGFYRFKVERNEVSINDITNMNLEIQKPSHRQIIEFVNDNPKKKVFWSDFRKRFISFEQWHTRDDHGIKQTITTLDQSSEQNQFLHFGIGSKYLIGKGINNSVSKENLKEFLSTYLRSVKELGLEEMEGLLAFSDSKEKKIQMKNFDVDYWVIGHPNSYFDDDAGEGLKFVFTIFPSILTLGTIPLWSDEGISSNYFVFDKNLIQIATIQTENLHESVTAWWCFGGQVKMAGNSSIMDPPPAIFYKPNLQRFSKELVQVLKK